MIDIDIYPREEWLEPILKTFPPAPANSKLPKWYKEHISKKTQFSDFGAQCPAIRSVVTEGIIIPAWSDIYFFKKTGNLQFELVLGPSVFDNYSFPWIDIHHPKQYEGMNLNDVNGEALLKLVSPYLFKTPKGYGLEFIDAFYHLRNTIRFLPGRVETDIWHETNFVFDSNLHNRNFHDGEILIRAGEPLCIAVPYKKEIKSKVKINSYSKKFKNEHMQNKVQNGSRGNKWLNYKSIKNEEE